MFKIKQREVHGERDLKESYEMTEQRSYGQKDKPVGSRRGGDSTELGMGVLVCSRNQGNGRIQWDRYLPVPGGLISFSRNEEGLGGMKWPSGRCD